MSEIIRQFGEKITVEGEYRDRPGVYGVITNNQSQILVVEVRGKLHLPGGGIEADEDPIEALKREISEETGYRAKDFKYIGQANQYLPHASIGPLNKLGTFYSGTLESNDRTEEGETDHLVRWISIDDFLNSNASDYQKWAVEETLK